MLDSDPYHPFVYWPHVVLGISSVVFAAFSIGSRKGSRPHRLSGWAFTWTMGLAAITAIAFSFVRFAPPALISATVVLYSAGMAILSLRQRQRALRLMQVVLSVLPIGIALIAVAAAATMFAVPPPPGVEIPLVLQISAIGLSFAVALLFATLAIGDIKFLRSPQPSVGRRYRRHGLRMALAVTEVVRAPLISFGPPLGTDGMISFLAYFFGPFLLIPTIYFFAMPTWLKVSGREMASETLRSVATQDRSY